MRRTRLTIAATLVASAGFVGIPTAASAAPATAPADVPVQFLTVNDLHGRIATPAANNRDGQITIGGQATLVGGAENIATIVSDARASFVAAGGTVDSSALIGMGDLVGASPFESAAFRDESTIEVLNAMGMSVSVVGNHEFDRGTAELRRLSGATDGTFTDGVFACDDVGLPSEFCFDDSQGDPFEGTDYPYLAANVVVKGTNTPILPPYEILDVGGGQRVGVIGVVTETTDTIVAPTGIADVDFVDEADAINRFVPELQAQGVQAIVALVHEGGTPETPAELTGCGQLTGPIVDINNRTSAAVDIVLSAHTHQNYSCYLSDPAGQPRLVAQAGYYGREIGDIRFVIDGATGDVDRLCGTYTAANLPVLQSVPDDVDIAQVVDYWVAESADVGGEVVGNTPVALTGFANRAAESVISNTIAEAQLQAMVVGGTYDDPSATFNGGVPAVAIMNPGGVRADIDQGDVTYNEAFTVQPFGNYVNAITLTGEQLRLVIEQQFATPGRSSQLWLGTSEGFTYDYDLGRPAYDRVDPASIEVDGVPVLATDTIRVVANSFLAGGGDSFSGFSLGTNQFTGPVDVDAFIAYLDSSAFAPGTIGHGVARSGWPAAPLTAPAGNGGGGANGGTASATGVSGTLGVGAAGFTCPTPSAPAPGTPGTGTPGTQPVAHPGNGIAAGQLANTGAATGQLTALGVGLLLAGGAATAAGYRRGRGVTE